MRMMHITISCLSWLTFYVRGFTLCVFLAFIIQSHSVQGYTNFISRRSCKSRWTSIKNVKRPKTGTFDGSNQVFDADIIESSKKSVIVQINEGQMDDRESPLDLHLGQVLSRGEKWSLLSKSPLN